MLQPAVYSVNIMSIIFQALCNKIMFFMLCLWIICVYVLFAVHHIYIRLYKHYKFQNKDEYKSKNPMGQVPTLIIDGLTLTQSVS